MFHFFFCLEFVLILVEQIVEVPMPMAQKEMVLGPIVVHHHSHHHVEQEVIVDDHVPLRKINHQE